VDLNSYFCSIGVVRQSIEGCLVEKEGIGDEAVRGRHQEGGEALDCLGRRTGLLGTFAKLAGELDDGGREVEESRFSRVDRLLSRTDQSFLVFPFAIVTQIVAHTNKIARTRGAEQVRRRKVEFRNERQI
jgi:hypothetical protein